MDVTWEDTQDPWWWLQWMPEHTDGARAAWFIENYCVFTDGDKLGEPFELEPWQLWVIALMFEIDPATGLRRWREFVLVIPRGNGKSALVSALGFYFLIYDGEGAPEVYSSAWGEDQAKAVFEPAQRIWEMSPRLQKAARKYAKAFTCPKTLGSWKIVSRIASTKQGKKVHALLNDELHVHPSGELRSTFIESMHKRKQPIAIDVTTEGIERSGPLESLQKGFMDAAVSGRGSVEKMHDFLEVFRVGRQIMVRWGVPRDRSEKVELDDVRAVRLCNPLSVIDVEQLIADEAPPAPEKREERFRTYYMNDAVQNAGGEGLPPELWDACADESIEEPEDGTSVWVAVDGGYRRDCSAVVYAWKMDDGRWAFKAKTWRPAREEGMELDLSATVGRYVDEISQRYRIRRIVGDPRLLVMLLQDWRKQFGDRTVREYSFAWGDTAPDSVVLLSAVQERLMVHDGDATYRQHVLNMRTRYLRDGAWRWDDHPEKQEGDYPNDAGIATMMLAGEVLTGERPSQYKSRGLLIIPPA